MEWLKELAKKFFPDNEEQQTELIKEADEVIKKDFVPIDEFNSTKSELEATTKTMAETESKLKELSISDVTKENEELKTKLSEMSSQYESFKNETTNREATRQKADIVKNALGNAKANPDAIDLLLKEFNFEEIQLTEKGTIENLDKLVSDVKEKRNKLFATEQLDSAGGEDRENNNGKYKPVFGRDKV